MSKLPNQQTMWRAFAAKDAAFDGVFYVAVKTTGIFCRPVCRAKLPRRENVEFFAAAADAERAGYRACKLCRPTESRVAPPEVVRRLVEMARGGEGGPVRGRDLAAAGIDPSTARRQFRRHFGVTFAAYQRAARMGDALRDVRQGEAVVAAQVAAGYESASGFRRAFAGQFGAPASRAAADVPPPLVTARFETPLGAMVGLASDGGVVVLDFHDRRGLAGVLERVRKRFGRGGAPAAIVPGENEHLALAGRELVKYFAGELREFTINVAATGSAFEREAWAYLRAIPYGQTRTYGRQASEIGRPAAVRAVGRANGMNYLSIVIPCHRVVGADGALTGYGGGLWRKKWLIEHERRVAGSSAAQTLWEARAGA